MAVIKKIDVEKHFAARRAMRLGTNGPQGAARNKSPLPAAGSTSIPKQIDAAEISPASAVPSSTPSTSGGNRLLRPPGSRQW